jgi:hypothetical protein
MGKGFCAMSAYRRSGVDLISRGFYFGIGWMLCRFVAGLIVARTAGLWLATGQFNPVARWIVRSVLIAVLATGLLVLFDV